MPTAERKRPLYLVLALLGALALGMTGARSGWGTVASYREPVDASVVGRGIADEADRAAVVARFQAYVLTIDAARSRGWPLGVATLVLGTAVLAFAIRALGGSKGARGVLVQLVVAQAATHGLAYWLMRDVLQAELRVGEARQSAEIHETFTQRERADEMMRASAGVLRAIPPVELVLSTLSSGLIVLALTRRRAREFFDAAREAVEGQ